MDTEPFRIHEPPGGPTSPLVVHVPHSATAVPEPWRAQLQLDDAALQLELLRMTDRYTDELYVEPALAAGGVAFVNQLSRLVFDPERFEDPEREPMERLGMGAVYTRTSHGELLRREDFSRDDREQVLRDLFRPYGRALQQLVERTIERFGRCLIVDGHSFPTRPLPYEDPALDRPDLCLGYEPRSASPPLIEALERTAGSRGWRVGHNTPFAGSYVPLACLEAGAPVTSVMLEIGRGHYMDEASGARSGGFAEVRALASQLIGTAVLFEAFRHTRYCARTPGGEIAIRVDQRCAQLETLLAEGGHEAWAYLTAWNPGGKAAAAARNHEAQRRLEHELSTAGLPFHPGEARADLGDWPPEASVLVLGIPETRAREIARRYGQAAIVVGKRRGPPRLVLA